MYSTSLAKRQFLQVCRKYSGIALERGCLNEQFHEAVAIYVHWPFCRQLCTYCNFNKYVRSVDEDYERQLVQCMLKDASHQIEASGATDIFSIYFGGGTPSLCSPSTIESIISGLGKLAHLSPDSEISLEANPSSSTDQKLRSFQQAGVNRISLGVQALNDSDLRLLNRDHSRDDSLRTIEWCQSIFPGSTSLDVMFARPGQTLSSWQRELQQVSTLCESHVSLYELTIEASTPLAKQVESGSLTVADVDTKAEMYQFAIECLQSRGLQRYQVSNFALAGCDFLALHTGL